MQVNCVIHGDLPDSGSRCSFFISNPVTCDKLKEAFPFEGLFHFRLKIAGSILGLSDVEYVWYDLKDSRKEIPFGPFNNNVIEIQAILVELPTASEQHSEYDYSDYITAISREIPSDRQNSCNPATTNQEETNNSFGKVYSNFAHNAKQSVPININLNTVKAGASSLWKAVKATASHIQQSTMLDSGSLSAQASENLYDLAAKLSSSFNDKNPQHLSVMQHMFSVMFPDQPYVRDSMVWKQAGWQKNDPVADLKTTGMLALHAMIGLCETYPERAQKMIASNKANTKNNYPFAIVGVNLTLMLAELFALKDNKFVHMSLPCGEMFRERTAFYEVFNMCFHHIDCLWTHRNAVRADFGKIIGEVRTLVSHILQRGPRTVEEFKLIGADEGMTLLE